METNGGVNLLTFGGFVSVVLKELWVVLLFKRY